MELALDLLVIVLQILWTVAHPTKPALSDWSKPQIKSIEQDAVDKQVNDYLMPILSSYIDRSTPAPTHFFQQKDIRQITDLNDLIKYLPPSLLTKKINFGGKKGSLLQITAVKPKSRSTSKAPLAILLATDPKDKNIVKLINSVIDDKDGRDANQSLELKPDTSDAKTVNEAKAAEEPRQEELAANTKNDLEKKAVPFLTDLELQKVFNEVLQDSDWKEDNADLILPDYNETKEKDNVQKLDLVKQNPENNQENYVYPRVDGNKELKDLGNLSQKHFQNKIVYNKEKEELSMTKAEKSDHKDHGPKTDFVHGNGIRNYSHNENKSRNKNKTNSYENEDKKNDAKHEQEVKNIVGHNQRTIHGHHHHKIRNETGEKYEAKDQEDKPYTRKNVDNETVSIERKQPDYDTKNKDNIYENDEISVNDNENNYQDKSDEQQENQASNELKHDRQTKSYENDDNQINEDEESNYQKNSHELHEKQVSNEHKYDHQASNQEHKEDQENDDEENNYQETSHENPKKRVISEQKQDQKEINHVHDENQVHNNEDKNYLVSDDEDEERDHVARNHDALGHDVRLHVAHDHQAEIDKSLTEDTMAEITQFDAINNQELLLSDDTIARLKVALTKAQEAENQLKSKSNECSPAELIRSLNNSESTKKSDHDNSNAKSYTLSFLFNK